MSEAAFAELKDDIAARGVLEPVVLHEDKILDGRHRARACEELGKTYRTRIFDGADALQFLISLNLHRRHLDESQRAMVAARIATLINGTNRYSVGTSIGVPTQHKAAEMLSVGVMSVTRARKVLASGSPSLVAAVDRGEVSVSAAARQLMDKALRTSKEVAAEYAKAKRQRARFERERPDVIALGKWRTAYWRAEALESAIKEAEPLQCPLEQLLELQSIVADIHLRLQQLGKSHGNESAARH